MGRQPMVACVSIAIALFLSLGGASLAAPAGSDPDSSRVAMPGSLSPLVKTTTDLGVAPAAFPVSFNIGLALHDKDKLDAFLADVSDPSSPDYQHFLTQDEFNTQYGPTLAEESRVVQWLTDSGFSVTHTFANHLLVSATGDNAAVEKAFGVPVHLVLLGAAPHYTLVEPPTFPVDIAAFSTGVVGLDDLTSFVAMHSAGILAPLGPVSIVPGVSPKAQVGSSCCSYGPQDLRAFYDNPETYDGTGQTLVIAGAYAWKDTDNSAYNSQFGLPAMPTGTAQVCTGAAGSAACQFDVTNSIEISLDVEMAHATSPGAVIKNYMAATTSNADFQTMYNKVVTDNAGHSVSSSWGSCEAGNSQSQLTADDNIFANGNAVGQSWFSASGDNGSDDCANGTTSVDHPADSPHVMGVGGTTPTCNPPMSASHPACSAYGSETAWSGSGGGASNAFTKPSWQTGCSVPADGKRDVPDIAMEADPSPGNWVISNGAWQSVGGTSDAAPQMGAIFTALNQKVGGSGVGLPGTKLYQLCGGTSFHDITSGSNGAYSAHTGYDQVTGVGTTDVANFFTNWGGGSATVPGAPTGLTATAGNAQVSLSWTAPSSGGSAITNYKIYRSTTSGSETLYSQTGGANTSYVDKKVSNGVTYYYKVSAVNSVGEGTQSTEASATPSAPTVPGTPTGLTATGGNAQVSLSWTAPSSGGSAITNYKIYRSTTSGSETSYSQTGGANTSYTDLKVTNGQTYYYKVSAVNSVGEGTQSSEASATPTACAGGGPSNNCFANPIVISSVPYSNTESTTGATLETGEPQPCGSIGATVWYRWTAPGSGTATISVVNSTTSYDTVLAAYTGSSLTGLTNVACNDDYSGLQSQISITCTAGTTYQIQLGGYQGATGTAKLWVTGCGSATVPGAPTGLTATAGNAQVSLSWTAPSSGGSAITNYKIYRSTASGSETLYSQTGGANTSYVDKKVSNGVTYYYKVSAVNSVGEGATSSEASATPTAPTVPGTPTGLTATGGSGQISLSWTAPSSGGSAITNYKIYRSTTSGSETSYSQTGGANTSYVDKKVSNGVTYYYKVSAVNSVGEGTKSSEASATPSSSTTFFSDNFESGGSKWAGYNYGFGSTWTLYDFSGTPAKYHSATHSVECGDGSSYLADTDCGLDNANVIDLSKAKTATLSFWHKIGGEHSGSTYYDYGMVWVSKDNRSTWCQLKTDLVDVTSMTQMNIDLSACAGVLGSSQVVIEFEFVSDGSVENAGWFIDDVSVSGTT